MSEAGRFANSFGRKADTYHRDTESRRKQGRKKDSLCASVVSLMKIGKT
jgi:hypothetical protein